MTTSYYFWGTSKSGFAKREGKYLREKNNPRQDSSQKLRVTRMERKNEKERKKDKKKVVKRRKKTWQK